MSCECKIPSFFLVVVINFSVKLKLNATDPATTNKDFLASYIIVFSSIQKNISIF